MVAAAQGARKAFFSFFNEAAGVYVVKLYRNRTLFEVVVVSISTNIKHQQQNK